MLVYRILFFLINLTPLSGSLLVAQKPLDTVKLGDVRVIDAYAVEDGYYVFYAPDHQRASRTPVVFVHGYGGLNPMIYGQWIRRLTMQGHCVIYPRYQKDLNPLGIKDFIPNSVAAINDALEAMDTAGLKFEHDALYLAGHSYGGVIIANLASEWDTLGIPQPRIAFLCEPGSGPFNGGVLPDYAGLDSLLLLAIVVGDDDKTVGQSFGELVYNTAINTKNRIFLWQYACSNESNDSLTVTAGHYEPYAIDEAFDNGINNFTTGRALKVAKLDHVDEEGYWEILDILIAKDEASDHHPYLPEILDKLSGLGYWPDGTELRKMECRYPGLSEKQ
jgi:pimeloyl-ACP methyl ester carboxylesterase